MIFRQNWLDVRFYLRYRMEVQQDSPETVDRIRAHLRHLLEWANGTVLPASTVITPTLPGYLAEKHLSPSSIKKGLEACRQFFTFARDHWPKRYHRIHLSWIAMLQPPRGLRPESHLQVHQFYALADMMKIAGVSTETLRQERAKVAACMLFLSGMRADAFASLPAYCVELKDRQILQLPELGAHTQLGQLGALPSDEKLPGI